MSDLNEKERAARKAAVEKMSLAEKADYIWMYYKIPIILGLVALYLAGSTVHQQLTKKEALLYAALINLSVGEDLEARLGEGFVLDSGADPKRSEVYLYGGLYQSDDPSPDNHQYQYASKMKVMAAIEAKQLDVVLMNKEAYDIYSQNDYLLDLRGMLSSEDARLYQLLAPYLTTNTVILEDNSIEYALNEATRYHAVTEEATNGLDVSLFPMFQETGFTDPIYLGVIRNSPRLPAVIQYIEYLAAVQQ